VNHLSQEDRQEDTAPFGFARVVGVAGLERHLVDFVCELGGSFFHARIGFYGYTTIYEQ